MTVEEKSFRYRQKFMTEISLYVLGIIVSVFLTMNHLMSVSRKKGAYTKYYNEEVAKTKAKAHEGEPVLIERPKDDKAKKND